MGRESIGGGVWRGKIQKLSRLEFNTILIIHIVIIIYCVVLINYVHISTSIKTDIHYY